MKRNALHRRADRLCLAASGVRQTGAGDYLKDKCFDASGCTKLGKQLMEDRRPHALLVPGFQPPPNRLLAGTHLGR